MSSNRAFIIAALCLICGTLLVALRPGDAMGVVLITTGTGAIGVAGALQKSKERKLRNDYDAAVEETQTLRRELLQKKDPEQK